MYVSMYVYVYVCMCVCMCVCTYVCLHVCMHVCMYVSPAICAYSEALDVPAPLDLRVARVEVRGLRLALEKLQQATTLKLRAVCDRIHRHWQTGMCACMNVRMHECMYECMYVCMYVCTYVCMYVCT